MRRTESTSKQARQAIGHAVFRFPRGTQRDDLGHNQATTTTSCLPACLLAPGRQMSRCQRPCRPSGPCARAGRWCQPQHGCRGAPQPAGRQRGTVRSECVVGAAGAMARARAAAVCHSTHKGGAGPRHQLLNTPAPSLRSVRGPLIVQVRLQDAHLGVSCGWDHSAGPARQRMRGDCDRGKDSHRCRAREWPAQLEARQLAQAAWQCTKRSL